MEIPNGGNGGLDMMPSESDTCPSSFGKIAVTLFAGYNATLWIVIGMLMAFSDAARGSQFWTVLGGLALIGLGIFYSIAVYALWSPSEWGRKFLCGCILATLPLYAVAIFPVFQNETMTLGNTLLQSTSVVIALIILKIWVRPRTKPLAGGRDRQSTEALPPVQEEEASAFTFDRGGKADDLFP